jgi:hypothetical protein
VGISDNFLKQQQLFCTNAQPDLLASWGKKGRGFVLKTMNFLSLSCLSYPFWRNCPFFSLETGKDESFLSKKTNRFCIVKQQQVPWEVLKMETKQFHKTKAAKMHKHAGGRNNIDG